MFLGQGTARATEEMRGDGAELLAQGAPENCCLMEGNKGLSCKGGVVQVLLTLSSSCPLCCRFSPVSKHILVQFIFG